MIAQFANTFDAVANDKVIDSVDGLDPGTGLGPKFLASEDPPGMAPHTLTLAPGAPIVCLTNLPALGASTQIHM